MNYFNEIDALIDNVQYLSSSSGYWEEDEFEEAILQFQPTELVFSKTDPSVLFEHEEGICFRGQDAAKKRIDIKIRALGPEARLKMLLTGAAGSGKTTLARIVAHRLHQHAQKVGIPTGQYFELLPNQIGSKQDLDWFMHSIGSGDIIFIDEIHVLKDAVGVEPLYHTLDDTGTPRYPLEGGRWLDVPSSVHWIAATTEPGKLDGTTGGALRRRLSPEIRMTRPTHDDLVSMISDQPFPISNTAANEIARRSGGLPWQALLIYREAVDFSRATGKDVIDRVDELFEMLEIDGEGLTPEDRLVIHALLESPHKTAKGIVRYKMSQGGVCATTGIDPETYRNVVQPKLMRNGLLTTVGGQCLTDKAVEMFNG